MKNIHYINAGAGSGKTYTLTEKLAERIISGACTPSEVMLTTFTELAAGEFRERAQAKLIDKQRFDDATALGDSMIGTVHSIAYKFVEKYWYVLGRGAQTNVMAEGDKGFYINQSLSAIAGAKEVSFFNDFRNEFDLKVGTPAKPDHKFWESHLNKIVNYIDMYDIEDLSHSVEKSKDVVRAIFNDSTEIDQERIFSSLKTYKSYCASQAPKTAQDAVADIDSILREGLGYANIIRVAKMFDKPVRGAAKHISDLPDMAEYTLRLTRSRTYGDIVCKYIDIIFELAGKWMIEFKDYKKRNRLIDFNDMELLFLQLLDHEVVQADIRDNFKLVLVDEFQDSNPTQLKIFDKLSDLVEESIWVGDPKQAIYGFRGSDADLINAITSVFPLSGEKDDRGLCSEALDTSWRSGAQLVEHTNSVFIPAFADTLCEHHVRLKPNRIRNEFGSKSMIHHWHSENKNKTDYYCSLAQNVAKMLAGEHDIRQVLCKETKALRDLRPEDIVILTCTNSDKESIIEALRKAGIKVSAADNDFMNKAEVRLVESLLSYALNSTNDLAKAEIVYLMSGTSTEEIIESRLDYVYAAENDNSRWLGSNKMFEIIDSVVSRIKEQSVSSLVESLILELSLYDTIKKWGDYENRQTNIDALLKMSRQYEDRCVRLGLGASLEGFLAYLPSMVPESSDSRLPGMVSVLTYHKSKGLEWNVVILDSLYKDELDEKDLIQKSFFGVQAILMSEPTKECLYPQRYISLVPWFLLSIKSTLPAGISADIVESDRYQSLLVRQRNEIKRLLYVGLTRARDFVITTSFEGAKELHWIRNLGMSGNDSPVNHSLKTINIWGAGSRANYHRITVADDFSAANPPTTYTQIVKRPAREQHRQKYISPSSLIEKPYSGTVEIVKDFGRRIPLQDASDRITAVGTCLHNIFCAYSPARTDNAEMARMTIMNHGLSDVITETEAVLQSIRNLYDYLVQEYGQPLRVDLELPFMNMKDGQFIRGSIDMVWVTANGCVVVDYKNFPGTKEAITNADNNHYAGKYAAQLREYVDVLKSDGKKIISTLIYYSVQGCVVRL